ncbi:hypothetical protein RRG08_059357 [Elysia crispata]|uniref:Uncharacterized protein n=1 Tax=Elysia crispata TaxID=231223 RepID=A0AAE1BGQ0_9GAST|nr:hypothetical protein RRG08_059357 [Elysia crispata]
MLLEELSTSGEYEITVIIVEETFVTEVMEVCPFSFLILEAKLSVASKLYMSSVPGSVSKVCLTMTGGPELGCDGKDEI